MNALNSAIYVIDYNPIVDSLETTDQKQIVATLHVEIKKENLALIF